MLLTFTLAQISKQIISKSGPCVGLNGQLHDSDRKLIDLGLSEDSVLTFTFSSKRTGLLPGGMEASEQVTHGTSLDDKTLDGPGAAALGADLDRVAGDDLSHLIGALTIQKMKV